MPMRPNQMILGASQPYQDHQQTHSTEKVGVPMTDFQARQLSMLKQGKSVISKESVRNVMRLKIYDQMQERFYKHALSKNSLHAEEGTMISSD